MNNTSLETFVRSLLGETTIGAKWWSPAEFAAYKEAAIINIMSEFWNLLLPIKQDFELANRVAGTDTVDLPGTEDKITNGEFNGVTGWTPTDCTLASIVGGQLGKCLQVTQSAATQSVEQTITGLTVGKVYEISIYVKDGTDAGIIGSYGISESSLGDLVASDSFTTTAAWVHYTLKFKATATTLYFRFDYTLGAGLTTLIDEVTMYDTEPCFKVSRFEVASTGQKVKFIDDDELWKYHDTEDEYHCILKGGKIMLLYTPATTETGYFRIWYLPDLGTLAKLPKPLHPLLGVDIAMTAKIKDDQLKAHLMAMRNHYASVATKALSIPQVQDFGGIRDFDSDEEID